MATKKLTPEQIDEKIKRLKGERGTWESHWQEVADHTIPRRSHIISKRTEGSKDNFQLLDSVGVHCNEILAGQLHSMLTPPNQYFMEMTTGIASLDALAEVKEWQQKQARKMHAVWANSNFHTEMHEVYLDLCSVGTANLQMDEDDKDVITFSAKFIANYFIDENADGIVDQMYSEWCWTPKQLIEKFGIKAMPKEVKDAYKEKPDLQIKVQHAVYPPVMVDPKSNSTSYICQYTLPEYKHEIEEVKYATFPNAIPRWSKASGEKYGRSPGMNALPELKVLNRMNQTMLIGAQKMVDPPLQMEDDGVILPLITRPGGINYRRPGSAEIRPIFANTNVEFGYQAMADRRQRVREIYLVDKLQLPPQQAGVNMTATETLQRSEESMRLMGPYVGRMTREILISIGERTYDIMNRRGLIDPPPDILRGRNVTFRFNSFIARSQRATEAQGIMRTFQGAAPFIQLNPNLAQIFDGEKTIRILSDVYGAPFETLKSEKDYQAILQQQAAAAAAAARQQQEVLETAQGAAAVNVTQTQTARG